ncbi:MAG: alpha/beta hydrolase [Armatimonadetes bacterium]|nr:alpha/beta hydrolase [Armatimonadota bacterium]
MSVIDINGLRVNYTDAGSGAPIVFVPGVVGTSEWFKYQSSGLSDRFRVITYDLRRARGQYSLDILVDDLSRLLTALKVYNAAVVGHSLGGLVALQFAVSHPERCPALVLCSVSPSLPSMSEVELLSHSAPSDFKVESFWAKLWRRLFGPKEPPNYDCSPHSYLMRTAAELDGATVYRRANILQSTDLTSALPDVGVPTLIVASSADKPYILAGSQLMDERIPDSALEVIENTDQYYFYTRHDLFNALLADYLAEKIARF